LVVSPVTAADFDKLSHRICSLSLSKRAGRMGEATESKTIVLSL
jgi:hypothetical protein